MRRSASHLPPARLDGTPRIARAGKRRRKEESSGMSPGNRRFVRTGLAILGLMALATATVWIALFMFVKPAKGETVDARQVYVTDGDTIALARERIRLLSIDAPETRDA